MRKYNLKRLGLTPEQYDEMVAAQASLCAICGGPQAWSLSDQLNVDHNHETGKVRGLLCMNCNTGLGKFKDNSELLHKAADYLEHQ